MIQLPDVLSTYDVTGSSVSRDVSDRTDATSSGDSSIWARSRRACSATICVPVRSARRCPHRRCAACDDRCGPRFSTRPSGSLRVGYAVLNAARIVARWRRRQFAGDCRRWPSSTSHPRSVERCSTARLPHRRHARRRCPGSGEYRPHRARNRRRPFSGWCPWSRRSRCSFRSLTSAIGATVLSASAQLRGPSRDPNAVNVIRRAYHVLFAVAAVVSWWRCASWLSTVGPRVVGFSSGPDDRWAITVARAFSR